MDSSKFFIDRKPSTLDDIGYATNIELTSKPSLPYLPNPSLGQDMTQGQFLSGV